MLFCLSLQAFFHNHQKAVTVNLCIIFFLIAYTIIGGFIFLHFEHNYAQYIKYNDTITKRDCIERLLSGNRNLRVSREADFARIIADKCLVQMPSDPRLEWSYKTAALYGFGILTTLGYGKVEPRTANGRIFTVIYGFIGIPLTVILLTNLGRYLEALAQSAKRMCSRKRTLEEQLDDRIGGSMSGTTLLCVVILYLVFGAVFIPLLNGQFDFFNGIYFAFICLTAIEYGDLVPDNDWFIPFVILYVCVGLAISTIALDIGSLYVRKLHYIGRKLKNIANIRIWFGARDLNVRELITAVGQNIGIEQQILADIDLDTLVKTAIQVKLGRLSRVPQTHMIVEGIWPPELVPLFIKDGQFPMFVDSEEDLLDVRPKKTVVRFEDEMTTSDFDECLTSDATNINSRLSPVTPTKPSAKKVTRKPSKSPSDCPPEKSPPPLDDDVVPYSEADTAPYSQTESTDRAQRATIMNSSQMTTNTTDISQDELS